MSRRPAATSTPCVASSAAWVATRRTARWFVSTCAIATPGAVAPTVAIGETAVAERHRVGHREHHRVLEGDVLAVHFARLPWREADGLQIGRLADLGAEVVLHPVAEGEDGDEGGHADDDAERGEEGAQRIGAQRGDADGERVGEHALTTGGRWRGLQPAGVVAPIARAARYGCSTTVYVTITSRSSAAGLTVPASVLSV